MGKYGPTGQVKQQSKAFVVARMPMKFYRHHNNRLSLERMRQLLQYLCPKEMWSYVQRGLWFFWNPVSVYTNQLLYTLQIFLLINLLHYCCGHKINFSNLLGLDTGRHPLSAVMFNLFIFSSGRNKRIFPSTP